MWVALQVVEFFQFIFSHFEMNIDKFWLIDSS